MCVDHIVGRQTLSPVEALTRVSRVPRPEPRGTTRQQPKAHTDCLPLALACSLAPASSALLPARSLLPSALALALVSAPLHLSLSDENQSVDLGGGVAGGVASRCARKARITCREVGDYLHNEVISARGRRGSPAGVVWPRRLIGKFG